MKIFNLIKRLFMDSHEKQSPQQFFRYAAMLIMLLTLGVGQMWGAAGLKGSWDGWAYHDISGGSCEVTLTAGSTYEFVIDIDGNGYSMNSSNFTTTTENYQIYTGNANCKITPDEDGVYIFKTWYNNGRYFSVYFPKTRLKKQTYFYFDARNSAADRWNSLNPIAARFYFKYYDNGNDQSNSTVNTPLETSVLYTTVPNNDYVGKVQINRMSSDMGTQYDDKTNLMSASSRANSGQNCLVIPAGQASAWSPTVQWTTYCPPKATSTISNNGTTTYGGSGTSESPLLVEKGTAIKVSASSTNTLDDGNMSTKYHFYDNTTSKSGEQDGNTYQFDASSSADVTYQMRVNSYNQYNSTNSSDKYSDKLYFKTVTCYTVTYNDNGKNSGNVPDATKHANGSNVTLNNNSGSMGKTGYSFNGWNTSDDGSGTHYAGGGTLSGIAANTSLYAEWLQTISIDKNEGDNAGSMTICFNATTLKSFTAAEREGWSLDGYWTTASGAGTRIITAAGTLISGIDGYTDNTGKWTRTATTSLFARWKQTYNVTYVANYPDNATSTGGSAPTDEAEYNNGATVTVLGNGTLTAGGYTFDGWQTSPSGGTHYATGATFTISANTVLYAKWVDIKTTVNLVASPTNAGTFTIGGDAATSFSAGLATSPSVTAVPATGFWLNTSATIWTDDANTKLTIGDADAATTTVGANGSGETSTLTAAFSAKFVLRGSTLASDETTAGMAGWSATDNSAYSFTYADGVYTIVADLKSQGTDYKFRIYDVTTTTWHGCDSEGQYIPDNTQWTLDGAGGGHDVRFRTTVTGNYTFKIDVTGDHPKVKIIFPVEPTYSVTIANSNVAGSNVSPKGTVSLKPVTTTDITATVPAGFRFGGWTVDSDHSSYVTIASPSEASTTVTAEEGAAGATITATYSQAGFIYFDDSNSDWGKGGSANVYVYFFSADAWYKSESGGKGPGMVPSVNSLYVGQMTRIGYTNIYYFDYQAADVTPTGYVGFTKGNYYNQNKVQNTSAAWRGDFNKDCYPMYVASSSYTEVNKTGYHSTGYWKKYNTTNSNVYLHGTWDTNKDDDNVEYDDADAIEFTSTESNSNIFKAEVELSNRDYWFYLYRSCIDEYLKNNGTITTSVKNWEFTSSAANNCKITAPTPGKYIFTLVMNDDHIRLNVDFPLQADDYRLIHYDGYLKTTETANHAHPSQHVSHLTEASTTVRDTISFFIDKDHKGSIKLQKCTNPAGDGGKGIWADSLHSSSPITIDISGITETGIYNFEIVQTTDASSRRTVTINRLNNGGDGYKYDGNLYIRTNAAAGGWDDYKVARDNKLIYSTIAKNSGYDYYHCHWIENGSNVKFCIANDYSPCITDSLTGDTWIGGSADYDDSHQTLPHEANVRFMYNSEKNTISRAYLNGATLNQRFLVFQGDGKSYNSDGSAIAEDAVKGLAANELEFDDKGNWVYQLDIKATTGALVNVVADYNDKTQNFITDQSLITTKTGDATQYSVRVVYDFKTNQLVSAWTPDGSTITADMSVTADMMLIRTCQNAAKQIHFSSGQKITDIKTMVGAIEFRKDSIVGRVSNFDGDVIGENGNRAFRELMLYISFPFDVAVQDIYGIGQLNREWYLQYYDGAERAAKGFFRGDGTTTFWKFMNITDTLRAGVGYSLLLDNEYFNTDGDGSVWKNIKAGGSVYLYFPSTDELPETKVIKSGSAIVTLDANEHTSGRTFEVSSRTLNHNFTDSHWNMMGVPLFENESDMSASFAYADDPSAMPGDGRGYFYEWDSINNQLSIRDAATYTFKSMHGYMVQHSGTVTFTGSSIQHASIVARRALKNTENYVLELQLLQNNRRVSRTYIELRDEASDMFALNEDVYMVYTSLPADLFTYAGDYDVSANVLSVQDHTIPVGIEVHKAGAFTFTMPSNFSGTATLVDTETGDRTNLAFSDYTVSLPKGVCDGRFYIEINTKKVPTAIDGVEDGSGSLKDGKAHKYIENGQMYILQNGVIYDAQGKRVK